MCSTHCDAVQLSYDAGVEKRLSEEETQVSEVEWIHLVFEVRNREGGFVKE
jgi:hypothetical protein